MISCVAIISLRAERVLDQLSPGSLADSALQKDTNRSHFEEFDAVAWQPLQKVLSRAIIVRVWTLEVVCKPSEWVIAFYQNKYPTLELFASQEGYAYDWQLREIQLGQAVSSWIP